MHRIPLENWAFEGRNNAYLLKDGTETVLVDTGEHGLETRDRLERELADRGVGLSEIDRIFLTHWHGDHAGLADALQAESGATVHVHAADAPLVEHDETAYERMYDRQREMFDEWGIPPEKREVLRSYQTLPDGHAPTVDPFEDDDVFELESMALRVVHASGHAAGLSCFVVRETSEVFSGDALLPQYTPNVGGADVRVESPLANYLETLTRIIDADYVRAWPGHRGAIIDPSGRAADIVVHHRHRTGRIVDYLREAGPADAWTVSAHLFGGLRSIHILHGPGEAYAHLGHLEEAGVVESAVEESGGREYALVESDPDLDALFPAVARGKAPSDIPGHG